MMDPHYKQQPGTTQRQDINPYRNTTPWKTRISFGYHAYMEFTMQCMRKGSKSCCDALAGASGVRAGAMCRGVVAFLNTYGLTRQSPVPSLGTWTGDSSGKREGPVEERKAIWRHMQCLANHVENVSRVSCHWHT